MPQRCPVNYTYKNILQTLHDGNCAGISGLQLYQKETKAQIHREISKTFKNTFFTDHLRATASALRNRLPKNLEYMQVIV